MAEDLLIKNSNRIISEIFSKSGVDLTRLTEGSVSDVFSFEINQKRYVIKYMPQDNLANELFFCDKARKADVLVPKVYGSGNATKDLGYYLMDYINGHNDPDTDTQSFFSKIVEQIKLVHKIKLNGFGKLSSGSSNDPVFEKPNLHSWIDAEIERLIKEFTIHNKNDVLAALSLLKVNFPKNIQNTTNSSLAHGDLGFGNVRFVNGDVYFIDPGWNRAMTPLWEVAYFDYKYVDHPKKGYRSDLFKKYYFPDGVKDEEEREMAIYRVICSAETYRWYLKNGLDEEEVQDRFSRNYKRLKDVV